MHLTVTVAHCDSQHRAPRSRSLVSAGLPSDSNSMYSGHPRVIHSVGSHDPVGASGRGLMLVSASERDPVMTLLIAESKA